ncbi:MAG: AAC(3)-I family aminoglycoside N-acetyltransferase [Beijerinckiaceae bacterium]
MPTFTTSHLKPSDLPLMRTLMTVFGDAFEDPDTFRRARPSDAYFERLLGKEDFIAIAATKGGAVVGGLTAYVLHKYEQERSEIYVYDLAVLEAHRREGVATALLNHLRAIGRERGAWVVFVQADYGDEPAIALYTKLGEREDVMHFDIAVAAR